MDMFRRKKKSGNKSSPREGEPFISPENPATVDESGACAGVSDVAAPTTSESYNPKDSKKSKGKKEKAKKKGGKILTEEEPVHSEQKQESFGVPQSDQVAVEPQRPQIFPQHEDTKHSSSQSKKGIRVSEDKPELVRRTEEFEQYKQDLMTKNSLLEKEKRELESKVKEAEESKKELDDMNQKYCDLQRQCQNTAKELQTRKDELETSKRKIEEVQQKNTSSKNELQRNYDIQIHDLKQQNEDLKGQFEEKKRKLNEMEKILAEKESALENLKHQLEVHKEESRQVCHRATELQQKVDSLHEAVKDGEETVHAKEKKLFELQGKLVVVFEDAATKDRIALAKQCEMQNEILELKKGLQQRMELDKTNQELHQKCLILETEITHQEAKLKDFQADLQEKEEFMANLHESLEKTKEGYAQMSQELKQKEMEFQNIQTVNDELKTETEGFKVLAQKTEEQKESLLTHFKDELKDKMETIAYLKLELSKYQKKHSDLDEKLPSFVGYLPQDEEGSALADKNILELKRELKPASADLGLYSEKQKSLELQPRNLVQIGVQMHSSAPGSMKKGTFAEDSKEDETCLLPLKSENEDSFQIPYESPHTSLTEAVNSVTVIEDNMTDAVKINIHHEIKRLQNKVELLEKENERLLSELEDMNSERVNLYKVKDKYLALVEERVKLTEKLQESESHLHHGDEVASIRSNLPVSLSSPVQDRTDLQEKEARICDLKIQMDTLSSENAQLQKQVVDLTRKLRLSVGSSKDGSLDFGLQEVKHTLTHEFQSIRGQLTRAESEQSDYDREMSELRTNLKKTEEENSELKMHAEILSKELESLKRKCEGEGHRKSLTQAAELKASRLEIALKDSKKALQRKDKEIQNTNTYVAKLEDRLQRSRQERDRQYEQITKLLAIKADLTEELQGFGDIKQLSHDFEEALILKNAEVSGLQEEKEALLDEIQSFKEEIEHRKLEVSYLKDDFEAERKDRENMASKMDELTGNWTTLAQQLNKKISDMEEECNNEKLQKEFADSEFHKVREKMKTMKQQHEREKQQHEREKQQHEREKQHLEIVKQRKEEEITQLTDQVEELLTKTGEQEVFIDQYKKDIGAKLQVAQSRLQEKQLEHLSLQEEYARNFKELNRVTEMLQSSRQDFESQLAESKTLSDELKASLDVTSAEKMSIEEEFLKVKKEMEKVKKEMDIVKKEMDIKHSQYEADCRAADMKYRKLRDYCDTMKQNAGTAQSRNKSLEEQIKEMDALFNAEKQSLLSIQNNLQMKLEETQHHLGETKQHYARDRQKWTKQVQTLDVLRRTMNTQLEDEKQRADEGSDTISKLSRDISNKDQMISKYEEELQFTRDRLDRMTYSSAQYESDVKNLKAYIAEMEREIEQLRSQQGGGRDDLTKEYQRLLQKQKEVEHQRAGYEAKFSALVDDYRKLRALAIQHNLKVPPRTVNPYDVQPFNLDDYNLQSSHNPIQDQQRRCITEYASGHGPAYSAPPEPPMGHPQNLAAEQGSHSPSAGGRVRRGSQDPSDVNHPRIRENELIYKIDDDITEAAANMEEKIVETSLIVEDDARPLDSNLICPLCGKQFRIGQIQYYRHHVDNCTNRPI